MIHYVSPKFIEIMIWEITLVCIMTEKKTEETKCKRM